MMAQMSDAFIALPGGFGTLEELAEVATLTQAQLPRQAGWRAQYPWLFRFAAEHGLNTPTPKVYSGRPCKPCGIKRRSGGLLDQMAQASFPKIEDQL